MIEFRYPLVYAVMHSRNIVNKEERFRTRPAKDGRGNILMGRYIVSKAYLLKVTTDYYPDRGPYTSYKVIFPYLPFIEYDEIYKKRRWPRYSALSGKYILDDEDETKYGEYNYAYGVFDNYEEAKARANELNEMYNKYDSEEEIAEYEHIEQEILSLTEDLKVEENKLLLRK